jgi:hypothetical protein
MYGQDERLRICKRARTLATDTGYAAGMHP